jgi:hypothetical protein
MPPTGDVGDVGVGEQWTLAMVRAMRKRRRRTFDIMISLMIMLENRMK